MKEENNKWEKGSGALMSPEEFEAMVRNRPESPRAGFYRLTIMTYGHDNLEYNKENTTSLMSDAPSSSMIFEPLNHSCDFSYCVKVSDFKHDFQPLYADYPSREEAVDAMHSLVGKHNIFAFTIERLPFGQLTHKPYWTEAWMFDADGQFVQKATCSAADYRKPGIYGNFFGHFADELPYKKGDIVVVLRSFPHISGMYATLGIVVAQPRDISEGYDSYRVEIKRRIRKGLSTEDWIDGTDFWGSDDDEYFVLTGPMDEFWQNLAFHHPMRLFPVRDTIPDDVKNKLDEWFAQYLHSEDNEQKAVDRMTAILDSEEKPRNENTIVSN